MEHQTFNALHERFSVPANYLTPRDALVDATIKLLREKHVIVIRATPLPDLELVDISWSHRTDGVEGKAKNYQDTLANSLRNAKRSNDKTREALQMGTATNESSRKAV
ncbi:MAG: hypothetical protein Q9199_000744 [Rusavskia elegans]